MNNLQHYDRLLLAHFQRRHASPCSRAPKPFPIPPTNISSLTHSAAEARILQPPRSRTTVTSRHTDADRKLESP
jgi:hypothetical protein